jgi:RecB family exonuclease/uncharacterized membrane protein
MKAAHAIDGRPVQVARRIAVASALRGSVPSKVGEPMVAQHLRAVLIDDLCRLTYAADACTASDAALACAAVEAEPGISLLARVAYGTRQLLHSSGFKAFENRSLVSDRVVRSCATLESALDVLHEAGVNVAWTPRAAIRSLDGKTVSLAARAGIRMLWAAYAPGLGPLKVALGAAPFRIDPANAAFALAESAGSPKEALAAAIGRLRGGEAKDAAVAALYVLDAIRSDGIGPWSLAGALARGQTAVAAFTHAASSEEEGELLQCAAAADAIWSKSLDAGSPTDKVELFVDSIARASLASITLAPAMASEPEGAIVFLDAPCEPVAVTRFALALGIDPFIFTRALRPTLSVAVTASLCDAVARYLSEHVRTESKRMWPVAEPPAAVIASRMTFSASRLNSYVKCPRRFFYEYLCEALEDPGSLHATYGRVMHDALERLHREIRFPSRHEAGLILERLLRELDAAFGAARADFASQLEYEASRWRARRMAEQYVRWLAAEAKRLPVEICGVEVFERSHFGGHDFVGYIDRIDKPVGGGGVTIYDYKTGRIEPDARAYLEKVRSGEEAQLAMYYAMRSAAGDEISRIALVSLRDPRDDVWILALDVIPDGGAPIVTPPVDGVLRTTCSRSDLDASLAALLRRCDMLTTQGLEHFAPGEDPPCAFCAYAHACRERPQEGDRAFAR